MRPPEEKLRPKHERQPPDLAEPGDPSEGKSLAQSIYELITAEERPIGKRRKAVYLLTRKHWQRWLGILLGGYDTTASREHGTADGVVALPALVSLAARDRDPDKPYAP